MRVFHLQFGTAGGTEQFFVRLTTALHEAGLDQAFAIRPNVSWRDDVAALGPVHEGRFLRRTPKALFQAMRLRQTIARFHPDAILAWRAPAARLIPDLPGALKLVRLGDYPRHLDHFGRIDCVIGNTPGVVAHCQALGWTGQSAVISNFPPAPGGAVMPRAALDTPPDVPLVCTAARFVPTKGVETVLRAVAQTERHWLWLVGDGPGRPALEALAAELGLTPRLRFAGWAEDVTPYIRAADVFCVPSRQEPLGNVVLEGWSCSVPVVTTRTEGPDWFATDGRDCLMVPIDDDGAMAQVILRLAAEPDLRATLVAGAKDSLGAQFSKEAVVESYVSLISDLSPGKTL